MSIDVLKAIQLLEGVKEVYGCVNGMEETCDLAIDSILSSTPWTYCGDGNNLPPEHDSMYAKLKGTEKWHEGMHEKESDYVQATVEYFDGTRTVSHLRTKDGKWNNLGITTIKVIAWKPMSPVYKYDNQQIESEVENETR